jgi:hypothetical protein
VKDDKARQVLFRVALALIGIVIVGAIVVRVTAPSDDCINHASERVNIVLDRTKPYSAHDRLDLDKAVGAVVRASKSNAQINVFYMNQDGDNPKTVLSLCRPNRVNELGGDPEEVEFELQRRVVDTIRRTIDLPLRAAAATPIVETLDTLSRERLVSSDNGQNSIFIFSDMVQSSPNGSLVKCRSTVAISPRGLDPYVGRVKRFYANVPTHIYAIVRDPSRVRDLPAPECLRVFWENVLPNLTWEPL